MEKIANMKRILIFFIIAYFGLSITPHQAEAQINMRQTASSVVQITTVLEDDYYATGTGTIITPTGLIYTNRHVIENGRYFYIAILEDVQELPVYQYEALLVYESPTLDFAVLQIHFDIDGAPIQPSTLNLPYLTPSMESVDIGQELHIFGYPSIADGYLTVTAGQIVAIQNGEIANQRLPVLYRTDSEISSGNSGGLAITTDGKYIGLPTWVFLKEDDESRAKLGGIVPIVTIHTELVEAGILSAIDEPIIGGVQFPDTSIVTSPTYNTSLISWEFINNSNAMICYMYISPSINTRWGEDKLANNIIFAGSSFIFEVPSGQYDILFHDCSDNEIADVRNIMINGDNQSYNYNSSTSTAIEIPTQQPQTITNGVNVTLDCGDGRIYTNTVEIQLFEVPANQLYHITILGLDGFSPVLGIYSYQSNQTSCVEEHPDIGSIAVDLPTTGIIKADRYRSTMNIQHQNPSGFATYSILVGSPEGETGEFVVMVDGASLNIGRNLTDIYSVALTPSLVYGDVPISVYMMGVNPETDSVIYLADPETYDVFLLYDTDPVICDDAGFDGCFGTPASLVDANVTLNTDKVNFRPTDSLLTIPLADLTIDSTDLFYFNFGATSYIDSPEGTYRIFFHLSNTGA